MARSAMVRSSDAGYSLEAESGRLWLGVLNGGLFSLAFYLVLWWLLS